MVLTPIFSLRQNAEFVIVVLKIPFLKPSTLDFVLEAREFKFCAHPYFLRLTFPHDIVEDGRQKSVYDIEKGELTVFLPKAVLGQEFENLDMITTLMAPRTNRPLVQEIPAAAQGQRVSGDAEMAPAEETLDEKFQKEEQLLDRLIAGENVPLSELNRPQPALSNLLPLQPYGFNNKFSDYFVAKVEHLAELVEVTDPDHMTSPERRKARLVAEEAKFDPEHYMGDFVMDEEIQELIHYVPRWVQEEQAIQRHVPREEAVPFTDDEKAALITLQNRNYILENERQTFLGLVDIIYAYAYDTRTTMGEHTVESWWTISRLSATLSWFDIFGHLGEVFVSAVRRSLAYPLYRNWELATTVLNDTKCIFVNGRRSVIKSLISVKQVFDKSDVRRHLSVLYINDYLIWLQQLSEGDYARLCTDTDMLRVGVTREAVGWPLEALETQAMTREEGEPLES